ncbi:MAG: ABC transporter ATP-binding protein [Akkermansiaceae bacterium]
MINRFYNLCPSWDKDCKFCEKFRDAHRGEWWTGGMDAGQAVCVSEVMIETRDLHRSYRIGKKSIEVLHGIDLKIHKGEKVFLCGPSGAGKTTLLYTLAGLESPERGSVHIAGTDIYQLGRRQQAAFRNRSIGYVFQNYHLLPELTALENVSVPGAISGLNHTEAALAALDRVELKDRADHLPAELSGGEQQRVAIARAIVNQPTVLFADEPTGNLDSRTSKEIMEILLQLANEHRVTLIVVTHDQELAKVGDRTLVIKDGKVN